MIESGKLAYLSFQPTAPRSRIGLRVAAIAGVLVASGGVAFGQTEKRLAMALGLILLVGVVLIVLRSPPLGLAGLFIASMLVPLEVGTGTGTSLNPTVLLIPLLTLLWLLRLIGERRDVRRTHAPVVVPLLLFVGVTVLSFGVGQLRWFVFAQNAPLNAQLGGLAVYPAAGLVITLF